MGCASSTPMIQTTGSEMLKAASHVATDATKTAEDAVEGIKDTVGKTLETAKDSLETTMEGVKHEVENVVKEKSEMLDDAKNSIMEKLHLKQTEKESNDENSSKNEENIAKTEADEQKIQLNENLKHTNDDNDIPAEHNHATKELKEHVMTGTDTETDSLQTSTTEPEIEQAFANGINNQEDEHRNSPPTPKPTAAQFKNLTEEFLKEQQQQQQNDGTTMVNDTAMTNDPVVSAMHENIKTVDGSNMMSLTADNNTIKDTEPTTTTALENNDIKSPNMHRTPQISAAVHKNLPQTLLPLKAPLAMTVTAADTAAATNQPKLVKDKAKQKKSKNLTKEGNLSNRVEEKRPRTTEWEKFADMLAQTRKFNPSDAFRRGGTFTKFGTAGNGPLRERSFLGNNMRGGFEDDSSDTNSYFRTSPQNSQRSSARAQGRVQRLPNRPNTGNNRRSNYDTVTHYAGGHYAHKARRISNVNSITGRKFDFNPTRSRLNEFVSSNPLIQSSLLQNTAAAQIPHAQYFHLYESIKSPENMGSLHSRSEILTLPPLDSNERARSLSQPPKNHKHSDSDNGSSMPLQTDFLKNETPFLTRQSSNTSLFSNSSYADRLQVLGSSHLDDIRLQSTKQPNFKNSSSFLSTPRSPFSLRKSYTDLYFSTTGNLEKKMQAVSHKSLFKTHKSRNVCSKKQFVKTING